MAHVGPRFSVGQVIYHLKANYRGVIVGIDLTFGLTEEWYDTVARSCPPKDRPWYRVLVDGASTETYVAERHLALDHTGEPISHPLVGLFFDEFMGGHYVCNRPLN